jgi:hypothetical protein
MRMAFGLIPQIRAINTAVNVYQLISEITSQPVPEINPGTDPHWSPWDFASAGWDHSIQLTGGYQWPNLSPADYGPQPTVETGPAVYKGRPRFGSSQAIGIDRYSRWPAAFLAPGQFELVPGDLIPETTDAVWRGRRAIRTDNGVEYVTESDSWFKPSGATVPQPKMQPGVATESQTFSWPADIPLRIPYRLLPHRKKNPWILPDHQRDVGPAPQAAKPRQRTERGVGIGLSPFNRVSPEEPAPRFEIDARPGAPRTDVKIIRNPTNPHKSVPPGSGTKEKKLVVRAGATFLRVINITTEGLDFVNALHDAVPDHLKGNYRYSKKQGKWVPIFKSNQPTRIRELYRHFDKIDWREAVHNLAVNQLEDMFWGKSSKFLTKNRKNFVTRKGVDIGPRGRGLEFGPAL